MAYNRDLAPDPNRVREILDVLVTAGVELAPDVEPDDVEDAIADDPTAFPDRPFGSLLALRDPEGEELFTLMSPYTDLEARAAKAARAAGQNLWELAVVPDHSGAKTGSARVRFGEWDVADVDFDSDSPVFELGILAAIEARVL